MSLTVNRTEEKESNWADLIDGLRYGGFRRSVSARGPMIESPESGNAEGAAPAAGTKRKSADPEPS
jgi:hypothetical protein